MVFAGYLRELIIFTLIFHITAINHYMQNTVKKVCL